MRPMETVLVLRVIKKDAPKFLNFGASLIQLTLFPFRGLLQYINVS